jgi:hypothetical protein
VVDTVLTGQVTLVFSPALLEAAAAGRADLIVTGDKGRAAEPRWCISWSRPPTGVAGQSVLPAFQAGHAGSIPVARSSSLVFCDFLFPYVRNSKLLPGRKPAHAVLLQLNCNIRTYLC